MAKLKKETIGEDTVYVVSLSEKEYTLALEISEQFNLHGHVSTAKKIAGTLEKATTFVSGMSGSMFLDLKPAQVSVSPKTKNFVISDKCAAEVENLTNAFNMGERETVAAALEMYRVMSATKTGGKLSQAGPFVIIE